MAFNRVVVVLGLAIFAGIVLTSMSGIDMRAQQTQTEGTNVPTQHSIKVTLAPDGNDCQLYSVSPEESGVYPSDQLVINVENGCNSPADVTIQSGARLFKDLPNSVSVGSTDRKRFVLQVPQASDDLFNKPDNRVEYTVTSPKQKKPGPIKGTVYFCRKPPCPPPS